MHCASLRHFLQRVRTYTERHSSAIASPLYLLICRAISCLRAFLPKFIYPRFACILCCLLIWQDEAEDCNHPWEHNVWYTLDFWQDDPIPAAGTAVPCTSVLHVPGSEGRVPLQRLMDFRLEAQCSGNGFEDMTYTSQMHLHSCLVVLPNEHSKPPELRGFCTGVLLYCADM